MRKKLLFLVAFFLPMMVGAATVWTGETIIASWSDYKIIDKSLFVNVRNGDYLRINVKDVESGAQIALKTTSQGWPLLNGTSISSLTGSYVEYLINSDMLAELKENNLVVGGVGYTLTGIEVIKPVVQHTQYLNNDEITTESWKASFTFPTVIVNSLAVGDTISIKVTETGFDAANNKWPQLHICTKSEADSRKDQYKVVKLKNGALYKNNASVEVPYEIVYIIDETDLAAIHEKNILYLIGTDGVKYTEIKLSRYVTPNTDTEEVTMVTSLYEGNTALVNWSQNYSQPASIINSLKAGDKLTVTIGGLSGTNCQLRMGWGNTTGAYAAWTNCYSNGVPYDYELTLTSEQVTAIKSAGKLYLNGCNITVTKWTLSSNKTVYKERGDAVNTIWEGNQIIDWSASPATYATIEGSAFVTAVSGMKLRLHFSNLKLGAQGRIVKSDWSSFGDVDTYEKLTTEWGDYFEYRLTADMVSELQANGMRITGVGYTLTAVQIIDPMREYLVTASFDKEDIRAWEPSDGQPNLSITLSNMEDKDITVPLSVTLMTDLFADYNTYDMEVVLHSGETRTVDVELAGLEAGFYRMAAKAYGNQLCTYYIGYNPAGLVSVNDAQNDFWAFWDDWNTTLAAIDMAAELTLVDDSGLRNVYEVKLMSAPDTKGGTPVAIWGYYAEPKASGMYPTLIRFHGTDSGSGTVVQPKSDTNTDWCEFIFSARGQMLSRIKEGNAYKVNGNTDFYSYGLGDNDLHYYRMAYLDCVRAVDFVSSRIKVNKNAIFASGGSQGGCFTYVCAALANGRIKAIAPSITGHADFGYTMETVSWPTNIFNNWINTQVTAGVYTDYAAGKAALLKHQSYFDTKNFASRITCPVITNFSLQDQTDSPRLNIAPYNLLTKVAPADKRYSINPFLGHSAKSGWEAEYMNFFEQYINTEVFNMSGANYATYYHTTATLLPAGLKAATIDAADVGTQTLTVNWRYDGSDSGNNVIPGGTAVIMKGDAGNFKMTLLPDNIATAPEGNLLKGSDVRTITTGGDKYYKLTYGPSTDAELSGRIGWYWGTTDGSAFLIDSHKAWLALTNVNGAKVRYFLLEDNTTTTLQTIDDLPKTQCMSRNVYDMYGRKIDTNSKLMRGVYIVNGMKVILE